LVSFGVAMLLLGSLFGVALYAGAAPPNPGTSDTTMTLQWFNATVGYKLGATDLTGRLQGTWPVPLSAPTLDTGHGANELYAMDQNVTTSSNVTFNSVKASRWVNASSFKLNKDLWYGTSNRTDTIQFPEQAASYIIWTDNSTGTPTYYAKNCTTGQIDYTNTDAATVIQAAINTLTNGGLIFVKSGEYRLSTSIQLISNLIICGEGSSTLFTFTGSDINGVGGDMFYLDEECSNIRLTSFSCNQNNKGRASIYIQNAGNNIEVDHTYTYNHKSNRVNIYVGGANGVIVANNYLNCTQGALGISIARCNNSVVTQNVFVGGYVESAVSVGANQATTTYHAEITNNIVVEFGMGVDLYGNMADFLVANNIIVGHSDLGSPSVGIEIHDTMTPVYSPSGYLKISNNILLDHVGSTYGDAIRVDVSDGSNLVIISQGNIIDTCKRSAIRVDNLVNGRYESINDYVNYTTINTDGCLRFANADSVLVRGTTVLNAAGLAVITYDTVSEFRADGLLIENSGVDGVQTRSAGSVIEGCRIKNAGGTAISIHGLATNSYVYRNDVRNNTNKLLIGVNTKAKDNIGFVTENSGSATNTTSTTFVFNHSLAGTPTFVSASFNTTSITGWTWTATSTQITITVTPALTSPAKAYWRAEYIP